MADIKLTASLDTMSVQSGIHEIRSQLGMALGSATGFNNAAMAMSGSPNLGGSGFGHTFTNAAMAYSPHYGAIQAHTTLQQEWQVQRYGLEAAQQLKPPGVSPASYAMSAMSNAIDRDVSAKQEASSAARAAFFTGAGGLAAGELASATVGAPVGAMLGGMLGKRFFGAGGGAAGAMIGGLAGSFAAFDFAQEYVGGKIEKHFAQVEQIGGVTRELGELAGGGRGLGRTERYNLGVAAREAAGDLKMDVQQMGDVMALGRQAGMMPSSTDPGKAREQYRDFARAIEEGAQVLQTSLAGATQVIKQAAQQGMSATQGITQAAGAGGADVWLQQQARMNAFGGAGASAGRGMGFTGAQGRGVYMGGLGAAGGAGLSGEELKIMGGRFGAAGFVGQTQMAMAASPTGDAQLMAAMGGYQGGGGMMDMAGAALGAMTGGGGDFMSNVGSFMVHKNEYRRGIGARGIQTMAREQMRMGAEMIQQFMPDLSANEAQRMFGISMGLDPDQAKLLAGAGRGGGGGRGGRMNASAIARASMARAESDLGVAGPMSDEAIASKVASSGSGFGFSEAVSGGVMGAIAGGGVPGALAGAGIGFISQNYSSLKSMFSDGPSVFASAEEKADYYQRKSASEYDKRMSAAKKSMGIVDTNEEEVARFITNDMSLARIDLDKAGGSVRASQVTAGMLKAAGLETVEAGAGTMKVSGEYYRTSEVQKVAETLGTGVTKKQREMGRNAAFAASTTDRLASVVAITKKSFWGGESTEMYGGSSTKLRQGLVGAIDALKSAEDPVAAGDAYAKLARAAIELSGDEEAQKAIQKEGLAGGTAVATIAAFTGTNVEDLRERIAGTAARGGGAGFEGTREQTISRAASYLSAITGDTKGSQEAAVVNDTAGIMLGKLTRELNPSKRLSMKEASNLIDDYWAHKGQKEWQDKFDKYDLDDMYESAKSTGEERVQKNAGSLFTRKLAERVRDSGLGARLIGTGGDLKKRESNQKKFQEMYQDVYLEDAAWNDQTGISKSAPGLYDRTFRDPDAQVTKHQAMGAAIGATAGALLRGEGIAGVLEATKKAVLGSTTTTPAAEMMDDTKRHDTNKKTGKPNRGTPLQRAAGFGERESAMDTINKSLRHTERALKDTRDELKRLATTKQDVA